MYIQLLLLNKHLRYLQVFVFELQEIKKITP